MSKTTNQTDTTVSREQVLDWYLSKYQIENEKKEKERNVMQSQLEKVTGGKNIILSNLSK